MAQQRERNGLLVNCGGFYDVRPLMDHNLRLNSKLLAGTVDATWQGMEINNPTVYVCHWYQFDTPENGGPATLDDAERLIKQADPNIIHVSLVI